MSTTETRAPEAATLGELIADCAEIPRGLTTAEAADAPGAARPWEVDETCLAQVADLDLYV